MFSLLRVPVVHGYLPEPDSRAAEILRKCPGVTNEDVQSGDGLPGLTEEEFGVLREYMRKDAHDGRWAPPLCTPAGLRSVAAALGRGGVGALYGCGHFAPVFSWPVAEPGLPIPRTYLLNYELVQEEGTPREDRVGWVLLDFGERGALLRNFCDEDFAQVDAAGAGANQQRQRSALAALLKLMGSLVPKDAGAANPGQGSAPPPPAPPSRTPTPMSETPEGGGTPVAVGPAAAPPLPSPPTAAATAARADGEAPPHEGGGVGAGAGGKGAA
jgi:hypothetical protein